MFRSFWNAIRSIFYRRRHLKDRDIYANTPDLQLSRAFEARDVDRIQALCNFYKRLKKMTFAVNHHPRLNTLEYSCYLDIPELVPFFVEQLKPIQDLDYAIKLSIEMNHPECLLALVDNPLISLDAQVKQDILQYANSLEDPTLKQAILDAIEDDSVNAVERSASLIYRDKTQQGQQPLIGDSSQPIDEPKHSFARF